MSTELGNYVQRIEDLHGQVSDLIAGLPVEAFQLWKGGQSKPSPFWFERLPLDK
jgi:hypothetical protein